MISPCYLLPVLKQRASSDNYLYPGSCFPGVLACDESFAESLQDDVTLLTKRIVSGVDEICVIETTALTAGNNCPFDEAVKMAENKLRIPTNFISLSISTGPESAKYAPLPLRTSVFVCG